LSSLRDTETTMQYSKLTALILTVVLLATAATSIGVEAVPQAPAPTFITTTTAVHQPTADKGDFVLVYRMPAKPKYRALENSLQESHVLEDAIAQLNNDYTLPQNVPVVVKECGEVAAYYDVGTQDITFCYEMLERFDTVFAGARNSEFERQQATVQAALFIFAHEAGHAMIDQHTIPFTGKEEDVADQFGTLLLVRMNQPHAAIVGGESFYLQGKYDGAFALWSEHSLDEQRYYNMMCWVYGSDTDRFDTMVGDELPAKRAKSCAREYQNMETSWNVLLPLR
jgi:hypothetical protein